jgi:hypothetical protein
MSRTVVHGKTLDKRTAAQHREVERIMGYPILLAQGSYNTSVGASGSTHAGGGAEDQRTIILKNKAEKVRLVRADRIVGFAAYFRPLTYKADGSLLWGQHVHCISLGCEDLSRGARWQAGEYLAGRDALLGQRKDPHAALGIKPRTFEQYLRRQRGRARVTEPTIGRSAPDSKAPVRKRTRRKVGYVITYVSMYWADDTLWLKTRLGTYYRAEDTSRG